MGSGIRNEAREVEKSSRPALFKGFLGGNATPKAFTGLEISLFEPIEAHPACPEMTPGLPF